MADSHIGDTIAAAFAASIAFLGAVGAAIKLWPKRIEGESVENNVVFVRIAKLEERADEHDRQHAERLTWRGEIFARLLDLDKKTSAILAILDERKHER